MIKSKKLRKIKNIRHGFFNSTGGKSKSIYKSLNCGIGSKDVITNVKKNLQLVRKKISKKAKNIFLVQQIHSNKFVFIDEKYNKKIKPKADDIITNQKYLPISILNADCVPILDRVIKFMIKKGCKLKNFTIAVGPSISVKNYEVKEDFRKKFLKKDKKNLKYFKIKRNKLYFDLTKYVQALLLKSKIKNIDILNIDTFDVKNKFFSARRALKQKHNDYGRNISIIMIK